MLESVMETSFPNFPLAELHTHLSTAISPAIYWQIAHDSGFKLPKKEFYDFTEHITLSQDRRMTLEDYFDAIYHPLLNKLSSGTFALEKAAYEIISGAYRANNITLLELRTNPMKHNNSGQQDLDHIIMAMLRGMERALLEYQQVSAGLIFCLAREFSFEQNSVIVEKAIKYHKRGVVGLDIAGPATAGFHIKNYQALLKKAKEAGLPLTVHCGETGKDNDMGEAIEFLCPRRIGHGIKAAYSKKLMAEIVKRDIVLEICPMSNIATKAVENMEELTFILRTFVENKVKFTINTDWPEVIKNAHLSKQFQMLKDKKILSKEELIQCNRIAFASTFVPPGGINAYL